MTIHIDSISVKGLGPISSINWSLKAINLIYGKNEHGKTYLVEYVLRSLFKNSPKTRALTDSGQVIVTGFESGKKTFSPRSAEKIDSLLFPSNGALVDLSRLCIIKEGKSNFDSASYSTISKTNLKEYLSDQSVLNKISEEIKGVVSKDSTIEDGKIVTTRNVGIVKKWHDSTERTKSFEDIFREINQEYSLGLANKARLELGIAEEESKKQKKAKCALANELSEQIATLTIETQSITDDMLNQAKTLINNLQVIDDRIQRTQDRLSEITPNSVHFLWLSTAIAECEKHPDVIIGKVSPLFFILSILLLLSTVVISFFQPYVSIGLGVLTLLFFILYVVQYRKQALNQDGRVEIEKIFKEFEERFGERALSLATLKSKLAYISPINAEIDVLTKQIAQEKREYLIQQNLVKSHLIELNIHSSDSKVQLEEIEKIKRSQDQKKSSLRNLENELFKLGISPEDYFNGTSEVIYDSNQEEKLNDQIERLNLVIKEEETKADSLKRRVCDKTRDDFVTPWDVVIEHLRERYNDAIVEQKDLCLKIVSGIIVSNVIAELNEKEDENIDLALKSPQIVNPIRAINPNYHGIDLYGEEILVFNDSQRFNLNDISTGAKDQILFALRIGLAEHVLQGEKMFFILDDAFQHSDWERRVALVDELGNLAKTGWQVLYFSMDDHIRDLFNKQLAPKFQDQYQYFEL